MHLSLAMLSRLSFVSCPLQQVAQLANYSPHIYSCRNPSIRWISATICTFSQVTRVHSKPLPFQLHFAAAQSEQLSSTTQSVPLLISQSIPNLHSRPYQDSAIIHP